MRLVIDTATRHAIVAMGASGVPRASVVREVVPGRGTPLLSLLTEALTAAAATIADIEAIGVGSGPGSFTGLRAGLATAKTLCWRRGLTLVALPTDESIRRAALLAEPALPEAPAVILPAGARDHYLALPGADPMLLPPSADLLTALGGRPAVALDLAEGEGTDDLVRGMLALGHPDPVALGAAALARAPEALLSLLGERLATGWTEDPALLVPRYVALPRGVEVVPVESGTALSTATGQDGSWSLTRR